MGPAEEYKPGILNESTLIPISLGISIAIFAAWVATLQASGAQNKEDLINLRNELQSQREETYASQKKLAEQLLSIDTRLSYIQGALSKK